MSAARPEKLSTRQKVLLARADLRASREALEFACALSREWSAKVADAIKVFGDVTGTHVSGIYSDQFDEATKAKLRDLCQRMNAASEFAFYEHRPRGVRFETVRRLARAVATRDGSGYYGPQGD